MSNLPEVAQSPTGGLEVHHTIPPPAPATASYYDTQHQYVDQHQQFPLKGDYMPVGERDRVPPPAPATICGVRRSTFWLAVILAIVVIGAAVGGGVGGSLAVSNAKSKSEASSATSARETVTVTAGGTACTTSTPSPTSSGDATAYTPTPPKDVLRIDNSCPQSVISSNNVAGNVNQYNCKEKKDFSFSDILWFTAYTLQSCIDGCSAYNAANKTDVKCKGVALAADLAHQYDSNNGANCWLKMDLNTDEFIDSGTVTMAWLVDPPE